MKLSSIVVGGLIWTMGAGSALAQFIAPGSSINNPPMPQPPPPPRVYVPEIPKMGALPSRPSVRSAPRTSFGDRVSRCLDEAAAAGLSQADRATYSRSCANTRE
ncbi:hypothetical protein JQ633_20775 [Bradyrhizobium tropiciagri]|uniref:hypothetical protein n=1 Tax=Bradyrhizobium tropiciagri TaxID=312253 RepID=UPI001BAB63A2|nr:hypothetical protein [Bradyrhizobium tropiciagri]MBR0872809.1 hypothetical protein [Bradyrhizobium tropiciagri]